MKTALILPKIIPTTLEFKGLTTIEDATLIYNGGAGNFY